VAWSPGPPPTPRGRGRTLPPQLTPDGHAALGAASSAVARVEQRMLSALPPERRRTLREDLAACEAALDTALPDD